jgi:AraC family ethanolamine operon transcriptional activator
MIEIYENSSNSIEAFCDTVKGYDLKAQQISRGSFDGLAQVVFAEVMTVALRSSSQAVYEEGSLAPGHAAIKFMRSSHDVLVCGKKFASNEVACIPCGQNYNQFLHAGTEFVSISVNLHALNDFCGEQDAADIYALLEGLQTPRRVDVFIRLKLMSELSCFVNRVFAGQISPADHLILIDFYNSILDQLSRLSLNTPVSERQNGRQNIVRRALKFIYASPAEHLSIPALLSHLHTSRRTLEYAFERILGVSPKHYITSVRLNRIREELLLGEKHVPIAQVARKYGVTHFGRFSQSYLEHFHELPSATRLRR